MYLLIERPHGFRRATLWAIETTHKETALTAPSLGPCLAYLKEKNQAEVYIEAGGYNVVASLGRIGSLDESPAQD